MQRIVLVLLSSLTFKNCLCYISSKRPTQSRIFRPDALPPHQHGSDHETPRSFDPQIGRYLPKTIISSVIIGSIFGISRSNAVGNLYELKDQTAVFQDICFNMINSDSDIEMFLGLFDNNCNIVRKSSSGGENITVLGFGPDVYDSPPSFRPGISSFSVYGGHSSITLRSQQLDDNTMIGYEKGNGLQFIKIGADSIRLSKAIAAGAIIKDAYGFVNMESPGGIPLQVVVGDRRDPIMNVCLRVSDLAASEQFFKESLGMMILPFQLARPPNSQFEAKQPPKSVYLGYSPDTLGVLLVQAEKGTTVFVGSQLEGFRIVFDDSKPQEELPVGARTAVDGVSLIKSPDGYPFIFQSYSNYKKSTK